MIEPIAFENKVIKHDSILIESNTGKMYFILPDSIIVPHAANPSRQREFEEKLEEFVYKFNYD